MEAAEGEGILPPAVGPIVHNRAQRTGNKAGKCIEKGQTVAANPAVKAEIEPGKIQIGIHLGQKAITIETTVRINH